MKRTYPCTKQGLEIAIADRHRYEATRRIIIVVGVVGLISLISPSTASTVAFKCI